MGGSLYLSRGHGLEFPNSDVCQSLKIFFILTNSADPDERPHPAALLITFSNSLDPDQA